MYKLFVFAAVLAIACANPAPEAKAEAKPGLIAAAYSAPLVAAAGPLAYTAAYSAPLTYAASPYAYSAYPAYAAYSSPYVAVL